MVERFLVAVEQKVESAFVLKISLSSKEISKIVNSYKPIRAKNFSLYCIKAEGLKFAIGVSKKMLPRAVDRNRVKRILREIVRSYVKSSNLQDHHIFIIAKSTVLSVDFTELKNEVEQLLHKAVC